jgi:hypothetical protein
MLEEQGNMMARRTLAEGGTPVGGNTSRPYLQGVLSTLPQGDNLGSGAPGSETSGGAVVGAMATRV